MKLQILYDNKALDNFKTGWGLSCFIEINDKKILFDTGWNGFTLLNNMKTAGINPEEIDTVVISHPHWDHIGGLNHILNCTRNPDVYIPESASENLKTEIKNQAHVTEVSGIKKIHEDVYTTGELGEKIKEQSLVLISKKGNIILTGCAHPGLEIIIQKSRELGDIYAVMGGFNNSSIDILEGIPLVVPCHCSEIHEIKNKMPISFRSCKTGCYLEI